MEKQLTIIRPRTRGLDLALGELWHARELLVLFVKRHLAVQYKQTLLGPLWFFLQPACTVLMYGLVFGRIAGLSADGVPRPLFYLAGTCLWQYFADGLTKTSQTFVANARLFGKVYFPRLVIPLSHGLANLLRLGIQLLLLAGVYGFFLGRGAVLRPNAYGLLLPLLVALALGLALGVGMMIASLTTKYRDLQVLFAFLVQLWMYATPVVYPLSQVAGKAWGGFPLSRLLCLNPLTALVETFRHGLLGAGDFVGWGWLAYSLGFTLCSLCLGLWLFQRVQQNCMDTV